MTDLLLDIRYALRTLRRAPGFTAAAVLTLAIGIGANTAIFSLVNGILFKPLGSLTHTDGLVELSRDLDGRYFSMSYPVFEYLREHATRTDDLAAVALVPLSLEDDEPSIHMSLGVSGNYFALLGLAPAAGRFFTPEESFFPTVPDAIVISHRLWRDRFQASPEAIGQIGRLNGYPAEVIGVAPEGYSGHFGRIILDIFAPIGMPAPGLPGTTSLRQASGGQFEVLGRLVPGASAEEAASELTVLANQFVRDALPQETADSYVVRVERWGPVPGNVRLAANLFFAVLMIVVGLALMMACTNVASMVLARSAERRREMATRLALGASARRIVRQLLTEALVLFSLGGVGGVLIALWATGLLAAFEPQLPMGLTVVLDVGLDGRVLAFSAALSMLTGVVFSLAPALRAARPDLVPALKDDALAGAPARTRVRDSLVALQMGVTVVLIVVAGLFLRALVSTETLDPGWNVDGVYVMPLNLEHKGYEREPGRAFYRTLAERVRGVPGVAASSLARKLPLGGRSSLGDINVDGVQPPDGRVGFQAFFNTVSPGYFRTMGLPLLRGRDVSDTDTDDRPSVTVVNRAMAERFWPEADPIGQRFFTGQRGGEYSQTFEVVGVVANASYNRLVEDVPNFYYLPYQQRYNSEMTLHVRVAEDGAAEAAVGAVRGLVRELDPGLPVQSVGSLSEALQIFFLPQRLAAAVSGVMGILGLLLGAVGIYGVTAFAIAQRTREIGVRMALGASRSDVIGMMLRPGLRAPGIGLAIGLAVALAASQALRSLLAGISPVDPLTFGTAVVVLSMVAVVAVLIPARRAARLDPMTTLRSE